MNRFVIWFFVFFLSLGFIASSCAQTGKINEDLVKKYLNAHELLIKIGTDFARKCHTGEISAPEDEGFQKLEEAVKSAGFESHEQYAMVDVTIMTGYLQLNAEDMEKETEKRQKETLAKIEESLKEPALASAARDALLKTKAELEKPSTTAEAASGTEITGDGELIDKESAVVIKAHMKELEPIMKIKTSSDPSEGF